MASISLDRKSRWWSVRYLSGSAGRRVKKTLCKHDGPLPRPGKSGRTPVPFWVEKLAAPFLAIERRAKLGQATPEDARTRLDAHVADYVAAYGLAHPAKTAAYVRRVAGLFVAFCAGRGVEHLQAVAPAVCRAYLAGRAAAVARSTLKTERGFLTPIFTQAERDGLVASNPWKFVRVEGKARAEAPTFWTADEVRRLLAAAAGWHRDVVLLAVNTGIRATALLGLRWSDIDWGRGVVHVRAAQSKSGNFYEVPLSEAAHDCLARRQAAYRGPDSGLIFESTIPGRPYASQTSYEAIKAAAARAGIPDYGDYNHICRRTFATLALGRGIPLAIVSRWLGHASIRTTQAYLGHRVEDSRRHMIGFSIGGDQAPGSP